MQKLRRLRGGGSERLIEDTFRRAASASSTRSPSPRHGLGWTSWEVIDAALAGDERVRRGASELELHPDRPLLPELEAPRAFYRARFIESGGRGQLRALEPHYGVRLVTDSLNDAEKSVNGSRVMLLGMAYKQRCRGHA